MSWTDLNVKRFNVSQAAITATGDSAAFVNDGLLGDVIVDLNFTAVTGTSPTLTVQLFGSEDGGTTWFPVGSATASITATGQVRLGNQGAHEGLMKLHYVVGGTTPSFTVTPHIIIA